MKTFKLLPYNIRILISSLGVICLLLIITNIVLVNKISALKNPGKAIENETNKLVKDIGEVILLPKDEKPTLATVSDPSKLKDQKFFVNAQAGDKVLLYQSSQKAVLWRPSTKKVIE